MAFFAESLEARFQVENEDVVGAAPTGDAPITSEWSTILLHTKVRLILEVLQYIWYFQSNQTRERPIMAQLYDGCDMDRLIWSLLDDVSYFCQSDYDIIFSQKGRCPRKD